MNDLELTPVLIIGIIFGGLYTTIIMISQFRNQKAEKMAMIASGKDSTLFDSQTKRTLKTNVLKQGILMIGLSIGLFLGDVMAGNKIMSEGAAYLSMILLCGGISLLIGYSYQKKEETRMNRASETPEQRS